MRVGHKTDKKSATRKKRIKRAIIIVIIILILFFICEIFQMLENSEYIKRAKERIFAIKVLPAYRDAVKEIEESNIPINRNLLATNPDIDYNGKWEYLPEETELFLIIGHTKTPCEGFILQECLVVLTKKDEEWSLMYDGITGFTHEPGYIYTIKVLATKNGKEFQDVGLYTYKFIETIRKQKLR